MEDLICTALGLGFSNTQLRNMKTSLKLRSDLYTGDSDDDHGGPSRPSIPSLTSQSDFPPGRKRTYDDSDRPDKRQRPPATPGNLDEKKFTGQRMPLAKSIVGASTPGAKDCDSTCEICGKGGTPDTGHRKFECPLLFTREYPGKTMPGFSRSGERIASAWDGANITPAVKAQWVRLHSIGYFTQPPFRKSPDSVPDMWGK
jgi:hypothetical protein